MHDQLQVVQDGPYYWSNWSKLVLKYYMDLFQQSNSLHAQFITMPSYQCLFGRKKIEFKKDQIESFRKEDFFWPVSSPVSSYLLSFPGLSPLPSVC